MSLCDKTPLNKRTRKLVSQAKVAFDETYQRDTIVQESEVQEPEGSTHRATFLTQLVLIQSGRGDIYYIIYIILNNLKYHTLYDI